MLFPFCLCLFYYKFLLPNVCVFQCYNRQESDFKKVFGNKRKGTNAPQSLSKSSSNRPCSSPKIAPENLSPATCSSIKTQKVQYMHRLYVTAFYVLFDFDLKFAANLKAEFFGSGVYIAFEEHEVFTDYQAKSKIQ